MSENNTLNQNPLRRTFWQRFRTIVFRLITTTLAIVISAAAIRFLFIGVSRVDGPSMEPTYKDGQWIIFEKMSYLFHQPKRFDLVEMIDPRHQNFLVKRVIGLPGETVTVRNGSVYISSSSTREFRLEEIYLKPGAYTQLHMTFSEYYINLAPGEYAVLGDNRLQSARDSRSFGALRRSNIIGHILMGLK